MILNIYIVNGWLFVDVDFLRYNKLAMSFYVILIFCYSRLGSFFNN